MPLALILALQAAASAPQPPPAVVPIDFDLARLARIELSRPRGCAGGDGAEIVVCAPRRSGVGDYPMEAMARLFATRPVMAETGIGGGAVARAYGESVTLDRGAVSNRIMIGIKMPF